jgi:TAG lipase/steryl ester hydrolase/phospholipase A2/LPA acyltransferase
MAVSASLVNSLVRRWQESFDERLRQMRAIQARMAAASSYSEWREFAQQLDAMGHCRGGDVSGKIRENLYDRKLLQQKLAHLQSVREHGNGREMMFALRTDLIRNIANVAKRYELV